MLILLSEFQLKWRLSTILALCDRYKYILRHLCRTKIHYDRHIFLSDHFSKAMCPKLIDLELFETKFYAEGVGFELKSWSILKIKIWLYYAHLYQSHWIPCHHTLSLDWSKYSLCRLCIPIHPHENKNSSYCRYSSDLHNRVGGRQIQAKILMIIASLSMYNYRKIKHLSEIS